jgi:hypothetical protein
MPLNPLKIQKSQKHSARHFIGTVRHHASPQPNGNSASLQPRSRQACRRARSCQGAAWKCRSRCNGGVAADLDSFCARRRRKSAVGAEECSRRGSNQRMDPRRESPSIGATPGPHQRQLSRRSGVAATASSAIFTRIPTAVHSCYRRGESAHRWRSLFWRR